MTADRAGRAARLAAAALAAALAGCAAFPRLDLAQAAPPGAPSVTLDTPFHSQTEFQCGPAALAGVLGATGVAVTPVELSPQVYLPEREGSLQVELLAATRRAGRVAYVPGQQPGDLLAEVAAGRPVLVLQNLGTRGFPTWHYAVLTGYDAAENDVLLNSGVTEGLRMPAGRFLRTWDWAGRWAMVALVPGQLPARADPGRYATAVAAFERTGEKAAARAAWNVASERWPDDPRPPLALGNLAYGAGDLDDAMRHYRRGLAAAPADPALNNNLATVLGEAGCPATGRRMLTAASNALESDSAWRAIFEQTLDELAALGEDRSADCGAPLTAESAGPGQS